MRNDLTSAPLEAAPAKRPIDEVQVLPDPPRKARQRFLGVVMVLSFLIAGLALVAAAGEWGSRHYAYDSLLDRVGASEDALLQIREQAEQLREDLPDKGGSQRQLDGGQIAADLRELAAAGAIQVRAAEQGLSQVWLLPWQDDIRAARDAYRGHVLAWQRYLADAEQDSAAWFEERSDVSQTWDLAQQLLGQAVPDLALPSLRERADSLINDDQTAQTGWLSADPAVSGPLV